MQSTLLYVRKVGSSGSGGRKWKCENDRYSLCVCEGKKDILLVLIENEIVRITEMSELGK